MMLNWITESEKWKKMVGEQTHFYFLPTLSLKHEIMHTIYKKNKKRRYKKEILLPSKAIKRPACSLNTISLSYLWSWKKMISQLLEKTI